MKGCCKRLATVVFYTKEACHLCEEAYALLLMLQQEYSFDIEERDIYTNDRWLEMYQMRIPVVEMNGQQIDCTEIDFNRLRKFIKTLEENPTSKR